MWTRGVTHYHLDINSTDSDATERTFVLMIRREVELTRWSMNTLNCQLAPPITLGKDFSNTNSTSTICIWSSYKYCFPSSTMYFGEFPLSFAACMNHPDCVRLLHAYKVRSTNTSTIYEIEWEIILIELIKDFFTTKFIEKENNHIQKFSKRWFIDIFQANINAQDTNGNTVLHMCVIHENLVS